jgi:uncharacterized protein (TIGR00251 family)
MQPPAWFHWDGSDLVLSIRAQPRASADRIVGPHGDALKVNITAPPVDGKANAYLARFLAKAFKVPASGVSLEKGATGRSKRLRIRQPARIPEPLREWIKLP